VFGFLGLRSGAARCGAAPAGRRRAWAPMLVFSYLYFLSRNVRQRTLGVAGPVIGVLFGCSRRGVLEPHLEAGGRRRDLRRDGVPRHDTLNRAPYVRGEGRAAGGAVSR
jgi:hypothetical protein